MTTLQKLNAKLDRLIQFGPGDQIIRASREILRGGGVPAEKQAISRVLTGRVLPTALSGPKGGYDRKASSRYLREALDYLKRNRV